ncbi:MAG: hypothetical protein RLY69_841, partial [Verrucomicrobiota bacterium]
MTLGNNSSRERGETGEEVDLADEGIGNPRL